MLCMYLQVLHNRAIVLSALKVQDFRAKNWFSFLLVSLGPGTNPQCSFAYIILLHCFYFLICHIVLSF